MDSAADGSARANLNPRALRALIGLAVGTLSVLGLALLVRGPGIGLPVAVIAAAALLVGSGTAASRGFLIYCSLMAAVSLLFQAVGLCSSRCGEFADYAMLPIGLPTVWAGVAYHGAMVCLGIYAYRSNDPAGRAWWWFLVAAFVGQGASLFYGSILLANGAWCSSCVAAHVCMLAQAVHVVRLTSRQRNLLPVVLGGPVLAALLWNLAFHHRVPHDAPGDYQVLTDWLSERSHHGQIALGVVSGAESEQPNGQSVNDGIRVIETTPKAAGGQPAVSDLMHEQTTRPNFASWGSSDAPLVVKASMSATCPACRRHWSDVRRLERLVDAGLLRVDFLLTYPLSPEPDLAAKVAAYYAYTLGHFGSEELLAALDVVFSDVGQQRLSDITGMQSSQGAMAAQLAETQAAIEQLNAALVQATAEEADRIQKDLGTLRSQLKQMEAKSSDLEGGGTQEAFLALFDELPESITMAQALRVYERSNQRIWEQLKRNFRFILEDGKQGTPRYFLVDQADLDGRPFQDLETVDPDVFAYVLLKKRNVSASQLGFSTTNQSITMLNDAQLGALAKHLLQGVRQ